MDEEQLVAWTRIKIHLRETMQLRDNAKERMAMMSEEDRRKVQHEIDKVVNDIEESMAVIEKMTL